MKNAVLMIHGLGGTKVEFGTLPASLQKAGLSVYHMVLPGHGGRPDDLDKVVMEEWMNAVGHEYGIIKQQHQTVHVVGMCMGALLACELVKNVQEAQGTQGKLVMLAPTLYLDGWSVPWYSRLRSVHYLLPRLRRTIRIPEESPYGIKNTRLRAIVQKRFERGDSFHYAWLPLQSIWQLDRLRHRVQQHLSIISRQTLIVHAQEDEFSTVRSAKALQQGIGLDRTNLLILKNSFHMVCIDNDKATVEQAVLSFLSSKNPNKSAAENL